MMYTGNYYSKESITQVPPDYAGSTFKDEAVSGVSEVGTDSEQVMGSPRGDGILETLGSIFPIGRILPEGVRGALHLDRFKLGTEELLIIALAVFLFLSRDGDKECALLIALLLLIH